MIEQNLSPPGEDALRELSELVEKLKLIDGPEDEYGAENLAGKFIDSTLSISTVEMALKLYKNHRDKVSRELIPSILNEYGLSELKLSTGEKVIVSEQLHPNISNKNYVKAKEDIKKAYVNDGLAVEDAEAMVNSLFKNEARVKIVDDKTKDVLVDSEIPFDEKTTIHYQTLKKYCKERRGEGKDIPPSITVFEYQDTKIK